MKNISSRGYMLCAVALMLVTIWCCLPRDSESPLSGITVVNDPVDPAADIVFVHGLGDTGANCWKNKKASESFPEMLAKAISDCRISVLDYHASPSEWLGESDSRENSAKALLSLMYTHDVGVDRPVFFVCHSLGGLVAKEVFRQGMTYRDKDQENIASNIGGFVFLATPHRGSGSADLLSIVNSVVGHALRVTVSASELGFLDKELLDLHEFFERETEALRLQGRTLAFYETRPTRGLMIVPESSAKPYLSAGSRAIPATGKNHLQICKPLGCDDPVFSRCAKTLELWSRALRFESVGALLQRLEEAKPGEIERELVGARVFVQTRLHEDKPEAGGPTFNAVYDEAEVADWLEEYGLMEAVVRDLGRSATSKWEEQSVKRKPFRLTDVRFRPLDSDSLAESQIVRPVIGWVESIRRNEVPLATSFDLPPEERELRNYPYWIVEVAGARFVDQ